MSYCQEVGHRGSLFSLASSVLYKYNDYKATHQTAGRSGHQDSDITTHWRAETETRGSSQGGAVDASSAGRAESERRDSSQGGAVDASSVPIGRGESDLSAASTSDNDKGGSPRGRSGWYT